MRARLRRPDRSRAQTRVLQLAGEIERRSRQIFYLERNCEQRFFESTVTACVQMIHCRCRPLAARRLPSVMCAERYSLLTYL